MGRADFIWADEVAAIVVVAVILWSAFRLLRTNTAELMDQQADAERVARNPHFRRLELRACAAVEKLLVRRSGMECFADIHIEVDPQATVEHGHAIGHDVKSKLVRDFTAAARRAGPPGTGTAPARSPPHDQ